MNVKVFASSLLLTAFIGSTFQSSINDAKCSVDVGDRIPCGYSGIGSTACKFKNCCWDSTSKVSISCFKPDLNAKPHLFRAANISSSSQSFNQEYTVDDQILKMCGIPTAERVPCNRSFRHKLICEAKGCCFDVFSTVQSSCYKPERLFVTDRLRKAFECTQECSKQSWNTVKSTLTRCSADFACWALVGGQTASTCFHSCLAKFEALPAPNVTTEKQNENRERENNSESSAGGIFGGPVSMTLKYANLPPYVVNRLTLNNRTQTTEEEEELF